jgi:hypothetical protein
MFIPFSTLQQHVEEASVPDFSKLMNFPPPVGKQTRNGKRRCIMCGHWRSVLRIVGKMSVVPPIIPYDNKGVCTDCQVRVWNVVETNLAIKFCQQCRNFRECAAFSDDDTTCKYCQCSERPRPRKVARQLMESAAPLLLIASAEHREMAPALPNLETAQVQGDHIATSDTRLTPCCVPWKGPVPSR